LQHRHREEYESIKEKGPSSISTAEEHLQPSVAAIFPRMAKDKSIADIKMEYIHAVTIIIMTECQPFSIVASLEFRHLFCPFHKEADKITNVPPN
jgi:hypothetical protein